MTLAWLRAAYFVVFAGFLAWLAFERDRAWFMRWPMVVLAVMTLGLAAHFARIAMRQRVK